MSKQKFPSDTELKEIRELLNEGPASRILPKNAPGVDRMKYALCEQFVIYKLTQKLTQRELAKEVGVDEAVMSKILHYNFEECTLDRLVRYLEILHKKVEISSDGVGVKIRVA
jgi:predicted XRE-type DNA-binding protein